MLLLTIDELSESQIRYLDSLDPSMPVHLETDLENSRLPLDQVEMWITYGFDVTSDNLDQMPALKWIQVFQAGVEHIPMEELNQRGVQLTTVKGIHSIPMAEYVMGMVLYYTRNMQRFMFDQKQHFWNRNELVDEAFGKTMAIFGAGTIGSEVARKAQLFGMHVIGVNSNGRDRPGFDEMTTLQEKDVVLRKSDFVVLLLPVTDETYHCIDHPELTQMKKSAYLMNIGRGALVDTQALLAALKKESIRGAALDVFEEDPLPKDHPLWDMDNVFITPHLSAKTVRYLDRSIEKFEANLTHFRNGESMINEVDVQKGY